MKMFKVFYYKYDIRLKNIVVSKETIVDIQAKTHDKR